MLAASSLKNMASVYMGGEAFSVVEKGRRQPNHGSCLLPPFFKTKGRNQITMWQPAGLVGWHFRKLWSRSRMGILSPRAFPSNPNPALLCVAALPVLKRIPREMMVGGVCFCSPKKKWTNLTWAPVLVIKKQDLSTKCRLGLVGHRKRVHSFSNTG